MFSLELEKEFSLLQSQVKFKKSSKLIARTFYWNDKQEEISLIKISRKILTFNVTKLTFLTSISILFQQLWQTLLLKNANSRENLMKLKNN